MPRQARRSCFIDKMSEPIFIPPYEERYFLVGDAKYRASIAEWVGAHLEDGEPISWTKKNGKFGKGIFLSAWMYDGLIATVLDVSVCIDNPSKVTLLLDAGDVITPDRGISK